MAAVALSLIPATRVEQPKGCCEDFPGSEVGDWVLGGLSQLLNNHGDGCCPLRMRQLSLPNGFSMAFKWG